jgi:predicted nucleotidyltransferase
LEFFNLEGTKLIKEIFKRDKKLLKNDFKIEPIYGAVENDIEIIADFTEYSPLHIGHKYCMAEAKNQVPNGIFVAIVPGPFERNGRGSPYIMTREARAEIAVEIGADIVVEGPPMGIMGSGQYSLCLAKTFKAIDADYIPRGYRPFQGFERVLERINEGRGVAPKPYKIVDMDTGKIILKDKLDEDNYVIVSLSKSLNKIDFNFKGKFIFVKRVEGVSGTKIREHINDNDLDSALDMMPIETVRILQREMDAGRAPLNNLREVEGILERVNNSNIEDLKLITLIDNITAETLIKNRPYNNIPDVEKSISRGFSRHYKNRVLSSLEAGIFKEDIHKYIDRYPSVLRILKYKNKEVLNEFRKRIPHRRLEIWQ